MTVKELQDLLARVPDGGASVLIEAGTMQGIGAIRYGNERAGGFSEPELTRVVLLKVGSVEWRDARNIGAVDLWSDVAAPNYCDDRKFRT